MKVILIGYILDKILRRKRVFNLAENKVIIILMKHLRKIILPINFEMLFLLLKQYHFPTR